MNSRFHFYILLIAALVLLLVPSSWVSADPPAPEIGEAVMLPAGTNSPLMIGCSRQDFASINPDYEQRVVELVNDERAKVGASPVKRSSDLEFAARFHSKDMTEDDYFQHDSYDRNGGSLVKVCSWNQRIANFYSSPGGENAAAGYNTPEGVMAAWMSSGGHKANILNTGWREIGTGFYEGGGQYFYYWVQDFGTRSGIYPLIINREYARTNNPEVSLYLYGQGVFTQMRLKNNSDAWSAWENFQPNRSWQLPWRKGIHRVTVELMKSDGSVTASYDEIELTTGAILGNLPASIFYIYDRSSAKLYPPPQILIPKNVGSLNVIQWQVQPANSWLQLSTTSGATPTGQTIVQPDSNLYQSPGSSSSSLTVQDMAPLQADGSPKVIPVTLVVVNALPYKSYVPSLQRGP